MMAVFLCGPLAHPPLLAAVLGRTPALEADDLADHRMAALWQGAFAAPVPAAGQRVEGWLCRELTAEELARLDFYAACHGLHAESRAGRRIYLAAGTGGLWQEAEWRARFAAEVAATAGDVMRAYGKRAAESQRQRMPQLLVRGAARVRAQQAAPVTRRLEAGPQDSALLALAQPYAAFFAVEEMDLRFRRFDGRLSEPVRRAAFLSGDAVTVLPYDPVRDRVLAVEQFRAGPHARGDAQSWQIEAIAGRIDPGETPEEAARREAEEEAGLTLGALLPVAGYYPSPGICAEFLYSYVALCDLPDGVEGVFGVEGEAEDIRGHLIGFDDLMALVASGEAGNGPLILTALWLQRERPRLRG